MYTYIHTCIHTYVHTYTHAWICRNTHMRMSTFVPIYLPTHDTFMKTHLSMNKKKKRISNIMFSLRALLSFSTSVSLSFSLTLSLSLPLCLTLCLCICTVCIFACIYLCDCGRKVFAHQFVGSRMSESCHTHARVMSSTRLSHTYEWVMSRR